MEVNTQIDIKRKQAFRVLRECVLSNKYSTEQKKKLSRQYFERYWGSYPRGGEQ